MTSELQPAPASNSISNRTATIHGGNLEAATREFGTPPLGWIDLSTGINPAAYPLPNLPLEIWQNLPQSSDETKLLEAAAAFFGVATVETIVAAPGSQSLIQLLPRFLAPSAITILSPTYGEAATQFQAAGHQVQTAPFSPDFVPVTPLLWVTRPNNPDGCVIDAETLLNWCDSCSAKGGLVFVDEAFIEAAQSETPSLASHIGRRGLVILRSFGKFFGLAGLRLGFLLAEKQLAQQVRKALGAWAVSGTALAIGTAAYNDRAWQEQTMQRLTLDRLRMMQLLIYTHLQLAGGTRLFTLINDPRCEQIYRRLGEQGILTRRFDYNHNWLRLGHPDGDENWTKLETALQNAIK